MCIFLMTNDAMYMNSKNEKKLDKGEKSNACCFSIFIIML